MRIVVGSDHAGYDVKSLLIPEIEILGHEVTDVGTHGNEPSDYPDFAEAVAREIVEGRAERGLLVCGSGVGEIGRAHV